MTLTITAACASLPPARAVTSVEQIAGKWEGTGYGPNGTAWVVTTVNPDGSYSSNIGLQTVTGKIVLVDGQLRGRSDQTGRTGVWALHEREGKRVLAYRSDDGLFTGDLTPAK